MKYAAFSLGFVLHFAAAPAAADPPTAEDDSEQSPPAPSMDRELARQLFSAGVALARAGRYEAAKSVFLEAHAAAPHYVVLYNIAQAELRLGEFSAAAGHLRQFLSDGGSAIAPEKRAEVEAQIARLERDAVQAAPPPLEAAGDPPTPPARSDPVPAADPPPTTSAPAPASQPARPPPPTAPERSADPGVPRAPPWSYAAVVGGLTLLAGGAAVYVWNDGRYQRWQQENAALEALKQDSLSRGVTAADAATLRARAQRNDQRLSAVQQVDPVPFVLCGVGLAAMGLGIWGLMGSREGGLWRVSADASGFELAGGLYW